jgi:hypothetical protein
MIINLLDETSSNVLNIVYKTLNINNVNNVNNISHTITINESNSINNFLLIKSILTINDSAIETLVIQS